MTETRSEQPEPGPRRPFDAEEWRILGIAKAEGEVWFKHRIVPADALRWQRAGVSDPMDAVRWRIAGVDPRSVREWIYAEIDAREAVVWAELGFNAASARKHKRAGRTAVQAYGRQHRVQTTPMSAGPGQPASPRRGFGPMHGFMGTVARRNPALMRSYMLQDWFDDEALAWATHGIEASEAIAWKELGLTPPEAERQQARGATAMQTAKAWWQAGIPVEEVADWIGAGLTPEEASEQRANGVTVEQAAVLRSLRKGETSSD